MKCKRTLNTVSHALKAGNANLQDGQWITMPIKKSFNSLSAPPPQY
jgi:hypothetical protein